MDKPIQHHALCATTRWIGKEFVVLFVWLQHRVRDLLAWLQGIAHHWARIRRIPDPRGPDNAQILLEPPNKRRAFGVLENSLPVLFAVDKLTDVVPT